MIYRLPEIISKEAIYYQVLPDLNKKYRYLKANDHIAVSLTQTTRINSNALPIFIGVLSILKKASGYPVYLELTYNPKFLAFLDTIGFFSTLSKYGIIKYNEDYIGGFSNYNYNKKNKILAYDPIEYYESKFKEKKQEIRDLLAEKIRGDLFFSSLFNRETTPINSDELWNVTMIAATELIVNAMVHSGSRSYTYIQSGINFTKTRKGHLLSIVDAGKGFYKSLGEKIKNCDEYTQEQREEFYYHARKIGIDISKEINYLSIMEALYFSQLQDRNINLFKLKNLLAISHANFRIHHYNREVVFSYEHCHNCTNRDALHCVECVWRRKREQRSPLKNYPVAMAGVHLELEFIQEKQNV